MISHGNIVSSLMQTAVIAAEELKVREVSQQFSAYDGT